MQALLPYRNALGVPGQGAHKYRIGRFAAVDVIGTVLIAGLLSYFKEEPFLLVLAFLMFMAIVLHFMFGVDTALSVLIKEKIKSLVNPSLPLPAPSAPPPPSAPAKRTVRGFSQNPTQDTSAEENHDA